MNDERRTMRAILAVAFAALVIRLGLTHFVSIESLDRSFVPDDTYYTLSVARSLSRGLGPMIHSGLKPTSGFQPLLAFLLVPLLRICPDNPDFALRAALSIGAIADAISVLLLGHLALRISGRTAAAITASVAWALSTSAIATSLNGLETSLAVTCVLGATLAFVRARPVGDAKDTRIAWAPVGTLLGLCLLARVDTVFFVAIVAMMILKRAGLGALLTSAVTAAVVVTPWWLYSLVTFGTIIPESGAAVREQTMMYRELGIVVRDQVAWATGASFGPPLFDWTWLREALGSGASGVGFVLGIVIVTAILYLARRSTTHDALRILAINAVCIFLFYALYLPATWFFRRYLVPVHVFATLAFALGVARAWTSSRSKTILKPALAVLALLALLALGRIAIFFTSTPAMSIDHGHHGAKGYASPAKATLRMAPRGAVIGSFQSGALGWFADGRELSVENLDGVVDGAAALAVRERRIAVHARSRRVTHLADWEVNVKLFLDRAGDPRITRSSLKAIGETERQGDGEVFTLYEITWPD